MKILWVDCETSGLDPEKNDILTLTALAEIDGKVVKGLDLKMQPFNYDNISKEALEVNGLSLEQIKTFEEPKVAYKKFTSFCDEFINRYDRTDKFIPAGYNVPFDVNFIFGLAKKCNDPYLGSYLDYHKLDVASLVLFFKIHGLFDFYGYKLEKVCASLNIPLDAHDAKNDIIATRKVYNTLMDRIKLK